MTDNSERHPEIADAFYWRPSAQMQLNSPDEQVIIDRGEGYRLWDSKGNEYIDGNSGVWCANLGYSQKRLVEAASAQLGRLPYTSLSAFNHKPAIELARRLSAFAPEPPGHVYYATSGAEAIEAAIKLARQFYRQNGEATRQRIISLRGSYHGQTLGALSVSGLSIERRAYEPLGTGFSHAASYNCYRCPWGHEFPGCGVRCADAVRDEIAFHDPENIAAILVEPILASGGVLLPPEGYLQRIAAFAKQCGALLIVDEVTAGMGRTGRMFSFEHWGLQPDIFVTSKGLTAGYQPLAAVITSQRVFDGFLGARESRRAFLDFHTFGGHPAACAVALEVLSIYDDTNLLDHVRRVSAHLRSRLLSLQSRVPWIGDVRGMGLMFGLEFVDPTTRAPLEVARVRAIPRLAMKHGLIVRSLRDVGHVICILPPLIIDEAGVDELVSKLELAIHDALPPSGPSH